MQGIAAHPAILSRTAELTRARVMENGKWKMENTGRSRRSAAWSSGKAAGCRSKQLVASSHGLFHFPFTIFHDTCSSYLRRSERELTVELLP
jgi:hypothetical protein